MRVGTLLCTICAAINVATAQPDGPLDSLLATWPAQVIMARTGDPKVVSWAPLDTAVSRARLSSLGKEVPVFQDDAVADAILLLGGPRRDHTELMLGMAAPWMPMIEAELREAGLPSELKYLPLAMSAMNLQATSANGEAGPWMLTYPVALRYGLVVNDTIDQRHDMALSTAAAIGYLKYLYGRHGRDEALLAMLCGPANLARAKARSGGASRIQHLYPYVDPAERGRVPAFMALRYLARYADVLGLQPVQDVALPAFDTVRTKAPVRVAAFLRVMDIDPGVFAGLNPELVGHTLPANRILRVPRGAAGRYGAMADSIGHLSGASASASDTTGSVEPMMVSYKVEPGDNLGSIAEEYGVTVAELREWNELDGDVIRAGGILRIRVDALKVEELERERKPAPRKAPVVTRREAPRAMARMYVVKRGDTLSGIAKRYPGISAQDIMRTNGIGESIRPGQQLKIPKL